MERGFPSNCTSFNQLRHLRIDQNAKIRPLNRISKIRRGRAAPFPTANRRLHPPDSKNVATSLILGVRKLAGQFLSGSNNACVNGLRGPWKTDGQDAVGTVVCGNVLPSGVMPISRWNDFLVLKGFVQITLGRHAEIMYLADILLDTVPSPTRFARLTGDLVEIGR